MTFLAPGWIALAAAASLLVAAIHLIAWRLPRTIELPTARFVPDEPARRAARTIRPADLALLALRVAILMAGGVAMARPVIESSPTGRATVIAIDASAAVSDTSARLDSLRLIPRAEATSFVVFDTTAQVVEDEADALRLVAQGRTPEASLSVGMLAATREARRLSDEYDRVDIVLVSPFTRGSFDAATAGVRTLWRDSVRVIRVAAAVRPPLPASLELPSTGDDPVLAGIRLARSNGLLRGNARVIRGVATMRDSAFADSGRVLVIWPRVTAGAAQERVDGVQAGGYTAVGHFIPQSLGDSGHAAARWVNGAAAAREVSRGSGCIRAIGFDVPDVGDFVLTPSFQRLASQLVGPCRGLDAIEVAPDSMVIALVAPGSGIAPLSASDDVHAPNRLAAIVMIVAILLALMELVVRRRSPGPLTGAEQAA